jgi:hypothetical protein
MIKERRVPWQGKDAMAMILTSMIQILTQLFSLWMTQASQPRAQQMDR